MNHEAAPGEDVDTEFGAAFYAKVAPSIDARFFAPLWHLIGLGHLVTTDLNRIAKQYGLSIADLLLLGGLRIADRRLRPTDLAAQLHVSNAALTGRIARLIRAGLVDRAPCAGDKRAFDLAPTPEGARRADAAISEISEHSNFARLFMKLDEPDRDLIARALGKLHAMVDREFLPSYGASR